jgi:hypothetical protein
MREENKQQRNPGKKYISISQRAELIQDVGDSAALLYHHYFDKAAYVNFDLLNDTATAYTLKWSKRKVQRERLKLTNANWLFKHTYPSPTMGNFYLTILGKKLIKAFIERHNNRDITEETITALQKEYEGKILIKTEE